MRTTIDINCDIGEYYGNFNRQKTETLLSHVSSCNVACGFHSGDPFTISETVRLALSKGVAVGAHPSFPDVMGFGRQKMEIKKEVLNSIIKYQCAVVSGFCSYNNGKMTHVKPHGALYNLAAEDENTAEIIVQCILEMGNNIALMGMAQSAMAYQSQKWGIRFIAEAFADRTYQKINKLTPRTLPNAVLDSTEAVIRQLKLLLEKNLIETKDDGCQSIQIESLCIHGDSNYAEAFLLAIKEVLSDMNVDIRPKHA